MSGRDIATRLALAQERQDSYTPNHDSAHHLGEIVLCPLIGITSVGKSHLIPFVIKESEADFSEVANMSTRATRPSDPENFRGGQSVEELLDRIEGRDMVNYVVHPSGDIYGTDSASYTTPYVLLPTLTDAVRQFQDMNAFKRVVPIGLVTDATTWYQRLEQDGKLSDLKALARMKEALTCIAWLRSHLHAIPILENKTNNETATARIIAEILRDPTHPHALDNQKQIEPLLSELALVAAEQLHRLEMIPTASPGK